MTRQPSDPGDGPPPGETVDWAGLRAAYEAGEETIADLCRRFAVTPTEIAARRRGEGWPPRPCDLDRLRGLRRAQQRRRLLDKLAAADAEKPRLDVEAVRALYEDSDVPNAEIRRRFCLRERELRNLRVREGWNPRPQIANPGNKRGARKPPAVNLAARLMRALSRQITMLEERVMADDYEQNDADIRLMNELARGAGLIPKPGRRPDDESRLAGIPGAGSQVRDRRNRPGMHN